MFHNGVAENQADSYNIFKEYVGVGAEFTLNTDIATLQAASGSLSDVTLSYTYYE